MNFSSGHCVAGWFAYCLYNIRKLWRSHPLLYEFKISMTFGFVKKKKGKKKNDLVLFWSLRGRQYLHTLTCTSIIHSMTAVYCYVCTCRPKPQTANLSLQGCHLKVNWGAIKTTGTTDARYSWGETGSVCVCVCVCYDQRNKTKRRQLLKRQV